MRCEQGMEPSQPRRIIVLCLGCFPLAAYMTWTAQAYVRQSADIRPSSLDPHVCPFCHSNVSERKAKPDGKDDYTVGTGKQSDNW